MCHAVNNLPQLFIVLIEGFAMAGGLGLSCIVDVVVTTRDAKFSLTEVTLGFPGTDYPVVIKRSAPSRRGACCSPRSALVRRLTGWAAHFLVDAAALERKPPRSSDARRGAPAPSP